MAEEKLAEATEKIIELRNHVRRLRKMKGLVCQCKDDCPAHQQQKGGQY
jgi:hypothetical protein